jgi:hypothetical protein
MNTDGRIEPCPICGSRAEVVYGPDIRHSGMRRHMWRSQCAGQDVHGDTFTRFTREDAVAAWNRLASREQS